MGREKLTGKGRLSQFIKDLRKSRDWTIRDVQERSNNKISHPYFNQVENGNIKDPSIAKLKAIADVFEIDPIFLFKLALEDIQK